VAWFCLFASASLFGQELESTYSPAKKATPNPIFEEWVIVVLDGKTCGYGSTVATETDTPT